MPLIAVVDDEVSVRTMLRRALRLAGYEVATFVSGEEFLDSLPSCSPACAILDIRLPGLSGLEVDVRMRAQNLRVPVVLITASDDPALDRAARAAGALCLLRKPFSTDALLAAVHRAVADPARDPSAHGVLPN
ncbi:response regulator transcription factor [Accumulibacter sp.]|uniref:response regulator transcription factor n=1 Tax=Accumulibacter sp. TaxID=2053492 RepID=UPI0035B161C6